LGNLNAGAAKAIETKTKRILQTIHAMENHWDYGQMIRQEKRLKSKKLKAGVGVKNQF